ncbi:LOW QUALITY PROTEIN: WAS/WASL-interacting protein family member 1 [Procambarus clarkii]|uniref:LOW QUALITY PROTEIN: WAS/WASL-interacting protein family member 1 n=1 Tax=Procambarus clarkii TaxID=6728 RepID=UPI00374452D3
MPPPPPPPAPGGLQRRGPHAPPQPVPKAAGGDDRNALLSSIRTGAKLKKTVTNDRSAPIIDEKTGGAQRGGAASRPSQPHAPFGIGKPSTNGAGGGGRGGGGEEGGGGGRMMNGGAPQLGLIADGVNRLRPTGRLPANSSANRSAPLLPPGRKPSPVVPVRDVSLDSQHTTDSNSIPPSPKPSSKSNPAPPPPPATSKPSFPNDRPARGPLPVPPNPASKPAPPRPPMDEIPTLISSESGYHPALPSKPVLINKPSVGSKPAPPRPPTGTKPTLPPKGSGLQPNGSTPPSSKPPSRSESMREYRTPSESEFQNQNNSYSGEDSLMPSRTLPTPYHHRTAPGGPGASLGSIRPNTVGRQGGASIVKSLTRPPSERPPPPPNRPSVPPPSQPPPPPPPNRPIPVPSASSKPEPPGTAPPPPPNRVSSRHSGSDFESKFHFHTAQHFPLPIIYQNCTKTYPSKNDIPFYLHSSYLHLSSFTAEAKPVGQRRAPPPPPIPNPSTSMSATSSQSSLHRFSTSTHPLPPPPPPHAPIHLQVGPKMYGTEASNC